MSIHSRICDDIAAWRRREEFYQREAGELSRVGDEAGAKIYRQSIVSVAGWLEHLNNEKTEIESLCHE